jgi:hypothetical protein
MRRVLFDRNRDTVKENDMRAGRKRKTGPREANGRLKRSYVSAREEAENAAVALEARKRIFGLSERQARDPLASTVVGRLCLTGGITMAQHDAALRWLQTRNAYQRALAAKTDYTEPKPEVSGTGTYEDFCAAARKRHADMERALSDHMVEARSPGGKAALDVIVRRDIDMPELYGDLRLALNCLARHFLEGKQR